MKNSKHYLKWAFYYGEKLGDSHDGKSDMFDSCWNFQTVGSFWWMLKVSDKLL